MSLLDPETRKNMIRNAVREILSAGLGSFCSISEEMLKAVIITIEATGEGNRVLLKVEGMLTHEQLTKVGSIIEKLQGDSAQLSVEIDADKVPELVEEIFSVILGSKDFDITIEAVTS